ncbi:uncharacterized protein PITG_07070 [Phytophthora infestans T30-4]|uniref:AB hydrolase-1 domain-containing protein n=1 Tax=Phytophthora infestans (strain T30-4) TaxID=403677 RepID=D0N769_PHYIT|nr:uncharacterized protein PITG_07070 [Phytophthora infestans T30-4]EEY53418.1 conserved hypothetical protein [Phytophthora infestans T30-4]|eukprot:XP_002905036.1 conserved hypothetical protein [Phytophthora infestans T30-4]
MPRATLLFAHGGGFCKQMWDPIIRRMKSSPVLQQVTTEFVTFDFPPRVWHPAQDLVPWTTAERPTLIGIGHSMGAGALWNMEVQDPSTFDELILFEPVYGEKDPVVTDKIATFLVATTLQREASWSSREEAVEYFETLKNFNSWDRESLATVLACHPHIEAALYRHEILRFTDQELKRPKCKVRFYGGERSNLFFTPHFEHAVRLNPDVYSMGEPMNNCTHLLVLEDLERAANNILNDLAKASPFHKDTTSRM